MGKKSKPVCGQVNIPTVDESSIECTEFVKAKCTVLDKQSIVLGLDGTETLYDFLSKLENVIKGQNRNIEGLNTQYNMLNKEYKENVVQISKLEKRVSALEREIKLIKATR